MTEALIGGIVVFVLATYLGASLIGRVPPTLHTPLMSGANAVSGITVVGAILVAGAGLGWLSNVLGFLAIVFAMMNVVGGYAVTDRMLEMFKKSEKPKGAAGSAAGSTAGGREGAK
ncbi:MAG TPA: NAD(P) transhydrogenase subunit alpha [Gemmatimonadaceae bacterium]|nr:NAD(P) transhydrogenase subunit alpha [Gemmatimonadaceae bacterium]